jgi:cyanophycinase-like exopeptidase
MSATASAIGWGIDEDACAIFEDEQFVKMVAEGKAAVRKFTMNADGTFETNVLRK